MSKEEKAAEEFILLYEEFLNTCRARGFVFNKVEREMVFKALCACAMRQIVAGIVEKKEARNGNK